MHVAVGLVALVLVVLTVTGLARRVGASPPLVLVGVGLLGSYLPFVPAVRLQPELVLVGLLPPLLYAAAIRTSLVDFRANRGAIGLLSVGATLFTTVVVGVAAYLVVPSPFSWPAAFALGAVVAPPDAVAATAVARRVGMPRRIVSILEGESLVNDATALVALNTAIAALASAAALAAGAIALDFALAAGGGLAVGVAVAVAVGFARRRIDDPAFDSGLSFVAPFLAYVLAEPVHGSGVLAVVVSGLLLGHRSHLLQSGASRLAESNTWRTIAFLLENAVFLLIGLQTPTVVRLARRELPVHELVVVCAVVLAVVLVSRLVWVSVTYGVRALLNQRLEGWSIAGSLVVGWAGMRGVVTLAAVFALPERTPRRGVLLLAAFVVVVGTLLLQGLSLPWLTRRLGLPGPDPAEDALATAALVSEISRAGQARLDRERSDSDPEEVVESLRRNSIQRADRAWERLGRPNDEYEPPTAAYLRLRLAMLDSERGALIDARDAGRYDDEVLRAATASLDVEESLLDRSEIREERLAQRLAPARSAQACEHLLVAPTLVKPGTTDGCEDCQREGSSWVHLRLCLTCGHVGCCDSSPGRHAERHFRQTEHPVMRSFEPHEAWRWCYVDEVLG